MMFAAGCFVNDAAVSPAQPAEVNREGDSGKPRRSGGSASFTNRNLVVDAKRERLHSFFLGLQYFTIGCEHEMVFDLWANCRFAAARYHGEFVCGLRADSDKQCESESGGVERRSQVRGGGGK